MSPKKTPLASIHKKVVQEIVEGSKKTGSSSKFNNMFDVDYGILL